MDNDKPKYGWEITIDFLGSPNNQLQVVCNDEKEYQYKWLVLSDIVCGIIRDDNQIEEAFKRGIFRIMRNTEKDAVKGIQYLNPAAIEKITIIEIDKDYNTLRKGNK